MCKMLNLHLAVCAIVFTIPQVSCAVNTTSLHDSILNGYCEHCLYGPNFCDPMDYHCFFGCQPGYVGPRCERSCIIQQCKECRIDASSIQVCTRCHAGYYGPMCNMTCSRHCNGDAVSYDTCDFHGNCIYGCQDMFSGPKCDEVYCPYDNCVLCDKGSSLFCKVCKQGFYPDPNKYFQRCIPCSNNCLNDCDAHTGVCSQCIQPWFGPLCDRHCDITNCASCGLMSNRVVCQECSAGLTPSSDRLSCVSCVNRNCQGQCNSSTGACPNGCLDGWFGHGQFCDNLCHIAYCDTCGFTLTKDVMCDTCKTGYYKSSEDVCDLCPTHCSGGTCNMETGHCLNACVEGYYGEVCQYICSENCVTRNCSTEGYCPCKSGWYGKRCDRSCPVHCTDCENFRDGVCVSCEPGWYGDTCDNSCRDTCLKDDYSGFVYCDKDTGSCLRGCYSGFHGHQCQFSCNENCFSNVCDQMTGKCVGCTLDWYGDTCDKKCSGQCKVLSSFNRRCHIQTGVCTDGCYDGSYGDHCNKTCNDRCERNLCDRVTGRCSLGCKLGYSGDNCEIICQQKCPNKCSPNCFNDNCDDVTKVCVDGCMRGWYGMDCLNICSKGCVDNLCNQLTGTCDRGCVPGHWGDSCVDECSPNCADQLCDRLTGDCTNKCLPTFYGYRCEKSCSFDCINHSCDQDTGACTSCGLGKQGPSCEQDCMPGYYGINCELPCGQCKGSSPCYVEDGRCPTGCELGWKGLSCLQAMSVDESVPEGLNQSFQIGIGCAVGVFICFILIVGVICWYKRRHQTKSAKTEVPVMYRDGAASIQSQAATTSPADNQSSRNSSMTETSQLLGDKHGHAQVKLQDLVTRGQFYSVYKGEIIQQGRNRDCCVKLVQLKDVPDAKSSIRRLSQEADVLSICGSHLNITSLITTYQNTDVYYIALENDANTGLLDYLHSLQTGSSTPHLEPSYICQLLQFAIDTCCGLLHLHKLQVRHRALQAACVYLTHTPVAKIGDFMWAERTVPTPGDGPIIRHPLPEEYQPWLAPESLLRHDFSLETDIWALGLMVWEMFTLGRRPYEGLDWEANKQAVINGIRPAKPHLAHFTLYRVMKNCWRYDREDRPTTEQLLQQLLDFQGRFASAGSMVVEV